MVSASSDNALKVLIEANREEVDIFENTKSNTNPPGELILKPTSKTVVLHDPKEPANIIANSFTVPLGHSTIVYIKPQAREIDASAKELSENQRGCRLNNHNGNMTIFGVYTAEACQLECRWKEAVEKCGCFPWNYPVLDDDARFSFCDMYGNVCFKSIMKNESLQCECPMDCNSITYSVTMISTPFDTKGMCSKTQKSAHPLMSEFYRKPFPNYLVRRIKMFTKNASADVADVCTTNIQYRAEIIFKLATNNIQVTVTSRRLSFFDKLSAFGKKLFYI